MWIVKYEHVYQDRAGNILYSVLRIIDDKDKNKILISGCWLPNLADIEKVKKMVEWLNDYETRTVAKPVTLENIMPSTS